MANLILNSQVNLSSRDFDGLRQSFFDYAAANFSDVWTDFNENSFAAAIAEIIAYLGDNLHFYLDRQTQDNFLSTTKDRQAAIDLATLIDYFPAGPGPSTGIVTLELDSFSFTYGTPIIKGFQVSNGNGILFEASQATLVDFGAGFVDIPVVEGETVRETESQLSPLAIADGSPYQSYILSRRNIILSRTVTEINDNEELVLTVSGVPFTLTNTLSTAQSTDKVYTLRVNDAGETTISFGNGEFGVIPPDSAVIEATYRVLADEPDRAEQNSGNLNSNTITTLVSSRTGVTSVNNTDPMTGGSPKETLEEIKINAPASLSALNRAVSLADFAILAKQVTGVNKAIARAGEGNFDVVVHIAPDGGGLPSSELLVSTVTYFDDKKMAKTTVFAKDVIYQPVTAVMKVYVEDTFKQSEVIANVQAAISNLFSFDNMDFGRSVFLKSTGFDTDAFDFYEYIEGVSGIVKIKLEKLTLKPTMYAIRDANVGTATMSQRGSVIRNPLRNYEYRITMHTDKDYILQKSILGNSSTLNDTTITDLDLDLSIESGTSTDNGASFLQDSSKFWETNLYSGQTLVDADGTFFVIASNTNDTLTVTAGTPADGSYVIVERLVDYKLMPNTLRDDVLTIVSNTQNSVTVSGGLGAIASPGNEYRIYRPETNAFGTNPVSGTAPATTGTVTAYGFSGILTTVTDSALAGDYSDDAFNGYQFILTSGDGTYELTTVLDYAGASGVFTLGGPSVISIEPTVTDTYICSPKYKMGLNSAIDNSVDPATTTDLESPDLATYPDNYFTGAIIKFTNGANEGKIRRINSSLMTNGQIFYDAVPDTPAEFDEFEISFNYEDDAQTIVFATVSSNTILDDQFFFHVSEPIGDLIPSEIQMLQVDVDNDVTIVGIGGTA